MSVFQKLGSLNIVAMCFCVLASSFAFGGEEKNVQEPEYADVVALLDSATGNLTPLERKPPQTRTNAKFAGFGGGESVLVIKSGKSPVRFNEGQKLEFVVRVASQETDPQRIIQFFFLKSVDDERQMVLVKVGSMGMSGKSVMDDSMISFNATKYGKSSFKFTSAQNLTPGEYLLSTPNANDGFCFGIDPAVK